MPFDPVIPSYGIHLLKTYPLKMYLKARQKYARIFTVALIKILKIRGKNYNREFGKYILYVHRMDYYIVIKHCF